MVLMLLVFFLRQKTVYELSISDGSSDVSLPIYTGIGMTRDEIPRALEAFGQIDSSLSRKYEGTGLGLPLIKAFAELHGGTIDIESTLNIGTTARKSVV